MDDETVATLSDCTTESIDSCSGSGIVGYSEESSEELLETEGLKGYQRPTISSERKRVRKSPRNSAGKLLHVTIDLTSSGAAKLTTTATRERRHSLDTCKTRPF